MAKSANNKASQWLNAKGIVLEETFITALQNYAKCYQKEHSIKQLDEIYRLIGTNKSHMSYWRSHPHSTQTKKFFKYKVITNAAILFCLNATEKEQLANKAGLSFTYGSPIDIQNNFHNYFKQLINQHKNCRGSPSATIGERMFEYFCEGMIPTKESVLALGISLELNLEDIQQMLGQSGYCLSRSLPTDMIAWWFIKYQHNNRGNLHSINEVLHNCGLPLLMTRNKI